MATNTPTSAGSPALRDELDAALAARWELGEGLEPEVTAAFLARVERAVAAQADDRERAGALRNRFTQRIAWSLGLGVPLTMVSGLIGGVAAGGNSGSVEGAIAGIIASLVAVVGLNVYYTEVEKELELARLYRKRR